MSDTASDPQTARQTPLYALHQDQGGRLVDFAGWLLPIQYRAGIMREHQACRERAALFDVSHMGQVLIRGADPAAAFERLVPGNVQGLREGQNRYTLFTNEQGGVQDDLIVGRVKEGLFVVVNAACREQDIAHMRAALEPDCRVEPLEDRALIALQGPGAAGIMADLAPLSAELGFMHSCEASIAGIPCRISRSGYTGEDGFEISVPADRAMSLAERLLEADGVGPAGLGARDSLRLEAGLCLYGQDLSPETTPVEAQLKWTIPKRRREAADFPGAAVILEQLRQGPARKLVGLRLEGKAPARAHTEIQDGTGRRIGEVTSGGFGPTIGAPIALGYVESAAAEPGTEVRLVVRGRVLPARVADLPFVAHRYKR